MRRLAAAVVPRGRPASNALGAWGDALADANAASLGADPAATAATAAATAELLGHTVRNWNPAAELRCSGAAVALGVVEAAAPVEFAVVAPQLLAAGDRRTLQQQCSALNKALRRHAPTAAECHVLDLQAAAAPTVRHALPATAPSRAAGHRALSADETRRTRELLLHFRGVRVTKEDVVKAVHRAKANTPAVQAKVAAAGGKRPPLLPDGITVAAVVYPASNDPAAAASGDSAGQSSLVTLAGATDVAAFDMARLFPDGQVVREPGKELTRIAQDPALPAAPWRLEWDVVLGDASLRTAALARRYLETDASTGANAWLRHGALAVQRWAVATNLCRRGGAGGLPLPALTTLWVYYLLATHALVWADPAAAAVGEALPTALPAPDDAAELGRRVAGFFQFYSLLECPGEAATLRLPYRAVVQGATGLHVDVSPFAAPAPVPLPPAFAKEAAAALRSMLTSAPGSSDGTLLGHRRTG